MRLHIGALLAVLLLLAAPAFADQLADDLANFNAALDAKITVGNETLKTSPQIILVKVVANNPYPTNMPIYVLRQGEAGWEVVKLLGGLAPKGESRLELEIEVQYGKETKKKTRYAIVGRGDDGQTYGAYFEVAEDWAQYEKEIDQSLTDALVTFVPIAGLLLVVLIIATAKTAFTPKSGAPEGDYTLRTLIFPEISGKPFEEKIADVMINPVTIIFELLCVGILVMLMADSVTQASGAENGMKVMILSGIGSFFIPFLYFAAAWYFEKHEEGKPLRFFAGMFVWGMFVAFLSFLVSSTIVGEMKAYAIASYAIIATMLVSPMVEETLKGMGIVLISGHHEYNDTLTGLLLGFTCGAGFAFIENWFYFSAKANPFEIGLVPWATLIVYRSFFNTLAHGCFTAAASTLVGYARGVDRLRKFARLAFIPGLLLAVAIHTIFNISALADGFVIANRQMLFYVFNPMLIILLAAMFFLVLVLATIDEKKRKMPRVARQPQPGSEEVGEDEEEAI